METSLHRELKHLYAETAEQTEVAVDGFRIDAVGKGCLVEIQHGSLAAIRDKVRRLLESHRVLVVKPIILQRRLLKWSTVDAPPTSRLSPKRGGPLDLFDELVFFTRVFPHPNLTIEAPLVEIEEWRRPAPVPKRRRRWQRNYVVEDLGGPSGAFHDSRSLVALGRGALASAAHRLLSSPCRRLRIEGQERPIVAVWSGREAKSSKKAKPISKASVNQETSQARSASE
jgi:hypothetical protein